MYIYGYTVVAKWYTDVGFNKHKDNMDEWMAYMDEWIHGDTGYDKWIREYTNAST